MSEIHVLAARFNESDCLVTATEEEDIWAWNNSEKWGNELPTVPEIVFTLKIQLFLVLFQLQLQFS